MLAAQKPSSLTTSMKGGEMEEFDSLPEQAEFPTLTNVIRNIGNEFDHLLKSLKEGDQEKVKTLVTVLPPKDLRSLMESEPILTVELGNLLNTIAAPVKMDKQRIYELICQTMKSRLKALFGRVAEGENISGEVIEELIEKILNSRTGGTSLNRIFEFGKLTDSNKRELWRAVYDDSLTKRLVAGWEVESQCTEEIQAILAFYVPEDHHELIVRITDDIVRSKNLNFDFIEKDKDLSVTGKRKEKMTNAIRNLESFGVHCSNPSGDMDSVRNKMQFDLLHILSIEIEVTNRSKIQVIEKLTQNPALMMAKLEELSKSQQKSLGERLKTTMSFQTYKELIRSKGSLQEETSKSIQYIMQSVSTISREDAVKIKELLGKFEINELFKEDAVWKDHVKFFDRIYHGKEAEAFRTALKQKGEDLNRVSDSLRERLEVLFEKYEVSFSLIERTIEEILRDGDLKAIEGNSKFNEFQRTELPREIEALKEYRTLLEKSAKWRPDNIKDKVHFEIMDVLVHARIPKRDYQELVDLTNRIINSWSIDEVQSCYKTADANILTDQMQKPSVCKHLCEYIKYKGSNKETDLHLMKQALIPIQRELKIDFNEFRKLQDTFIRENNFEAARTCLTITEDQRGKLLEFLTKNKQCEAYFVSCKKIELAKILEDLQTELERCLNRTGGKGKKTHPVIKYLDTIFSAITEFLVIDERIADKKYTYPMSKVLEQFVDEQVVQCMTDFYESDAYLTFRKTFEFYVKIHQDKAEMTLKQFFDSQVKAQLVSEQEGQEIYKEWKSNNFAREGLSEVDTRIPPKKLAALAAAVDESDQHENLLNLMEAVEFNKELIEIAKYNKAVDNIKYERELWKFDKDEIQDFTEGLRVMSKEAITNCTNLAETEKKSLAKKLRQSDGFKSLLAVKEQITSLNLEEFKVALEALCEEQFDEPASEVKEDQEESVSPKKRIVAPPPPPVPVKRPSVPAPGPVKSPVKPGVGAVAPPPVPPPAPPKDEDYLKARLKAKDPAAEWKNQHFFELGVTAEEFKANTNPPYLAAQVARISKEVDDLVEDIFVKSKGLDGDQLGVFQENENPSLGDIRNKLREGSLDFPETIKKGPRTKLQTQIEPREQFKKIVELTKVKASLV